MAPGRQTPSPAGRPDARAEDGKSAFWRESVPALVARLTTSVGGLGESEAEERLAEVGPNVVVAHRERPVLIQFLSRFGNPLVLLLLGASTVSAFTGDRPSFWIILFIVLMSVTIDFVQEHRAARSAARLKDSVAVRATVVRGGQAREIPVNTLVPGDVVALGAGDLVPADGVLLEARDLFVNQALLTGEPYPVEKRPGPEGDPAAGTARRGVQRGVHGHLGHQRQRPRARGQRPAVRPRSEASAPSLSTRAARRRPSRSAPAASAC